MAQPICCVVKGMAEGTILIGVEMRSREQSEGLLTLLKRGPIVFVKVIVSTKVGGRDPPVQETNKYQYGENSQPLFHIEICVLFTNRANLQIGPNCRNNIAFLAAHTFPGVTQEGWAGTPYFPKPLVSSVSVRHK